MTSDAGGFARRTHGAGDRSPGDLAARRRIEAPVVGRQAFEHVNDLLQVRCCVTGRFNRLQQVAGEGHETDSILLPQDKVCEGGRDVPGVAEFRKTAGDDR